MDSETFFEQLFPTRKKQAAYWKYSVRQDIRETAFNQACGWWKKFGPVGKFYYLFYWHLFMEGPKAIPDGLSFDYFGDTLFWSFPAAEGSLAHLVGKRKR